MIGYGQIMKIKKITAANNTQTTPTSWARSGSSLGRTIKSIIFGHCW